MSVLKRRSNVGLIIGIIVMLSLIPIWYTMVVPSIIASEIEKIDSITSFEGSIRQMRWTGPTIPIQIEAHAYVKEVKGDNVILKVEANMTRTDLNKTLPEFSVNSTYVFNKFTRENVKDAPEADKPREGYDPLYPLHLKAGEDIPNVWLDSLNITATLEFKESIEEEGVTLYKYFVNKTVTKMMDLGFGLRDYTLTLTRTILIEPLSGLPAYSENETFSLVMTYEQTEHPLVYPLTYNSTAEAKREGIAVVKAAYDGLQLLELYIPTVLGVIVIVLIAGLAFNVRRLRRRPP